ncbi:MAG: helix-turn-helix domain-containing protein, partial [Candidatus Poseidoniales archaeon]
TQNTVINNQRLVGSEKEELIPNFHIKIREERETQNLSQEDLAKKINERVNIIQKIENGNRVTDSVIKKLAKALDIILYEGITPQNERIVKTKEDNEMTMADANISDVTATPKSKTPKKKMRKLGVT